MIRSNQNLFRVFPTRVSPALRHPTKVVRYSAGLQTISDQIYLYCGSGVWTPLNLQSQLGNNSMEEFFDKNVKES